jgi:flavin reductase (DIM6/NTAB) family NADH-FMN oxidoreductase RutF
MAVKVASPLIAEALAAFECRRHVTLELGIIPPDHGPCMVIIAFEKSFY